MAVMGRAVVMSVVLVGAPLLVPACVGDDPTPVAASDEAGTPGGPGPGAGADASSPGSSDAGCNAASPAKCNGDSLVRCASGVPTSEVCALGCADGACNQILPTSAVSGVDGRAATYTTPIDVEDTVYVDATTGVIERRMGGTTFGTPIRVAGDAGNKSGILFSTVAQSAAGAPKLGVFTFDTLTVGAKTHVQVVGANAVAFVAKHAITINGVVSARGKCEFLPGDPSLPGPGGFAAGLPAAAADGLPQGGQDSTVSAVNPYACGGCGGGGNGGAGQYGGNAVDGARSSLGGAAGVKRGKSILLTPILSGGGGGGGNGGPGGGALTLVTSDAIVIAGTVEAGGCHGMKAGFSNSNVCTLGGGGGGAGGTLLFEAASVTLIGAGRVLANGGGGGGGANGNEAMKADGSDASSTDATAAPGGTSGAFNGMACASAGHGSPLVAESLQCDAAGNATRAGGGGGGAGLIAARTRDATVHVQGSSIISPPIEKDFAKTR